MARAFEGIRVIDFTQVLAGPLAAEQLALLGADVIKIEQAGAGDQGRGMMADHKLGEAGWSSIFMSVNSGKRSITLNLKHPDAREIVHRLVKDADVVVQNFKAGGMARMGFGWEDLRKINPKLVYCSISGYGQEGPSASAPAYDGAIQAASGMMSITGHPNTGPVRVGFTVVDMATGITAAYAIASALFRRERTGDGQHLDVAMMDTSLTMLAPMLCNTAATGSAPGLVGNTSPAQIPTAGCFETRDKPILMTCITQGQWLGLVKALERPELAEDPRFTDLPSRRKHADELERILLEIFSTADARDWERRLNTAGVPAAAVNDLPSVMQHPQLSHRQVLQRRPSPLGGEDMTLISAGFIANEDGPTIDRAPPAMGADTDAVLGELGLSSAEIGDLRQKGAI